MGVRPLCAVGMGLLAVGLVFDIVGLATPAWSVVTTEDGSQEIKGKAGLWSFCNTRDGCRDYDLMPEVPDFVKASQAMALLGMMASVAAFVAAGAVIYFIHTGHECPSGVRVATLVSSIFSVIFILIAVIVMVVKTQDDVPEAKPGYSSALSIVAAGLILFGGVIHFCAAR